MTETSYRIPSGSLLALTKAIERLSKKSEKAGAGPIVLTIVGDHVERPGDGTIRQFHDITISGEPIKHNGWTFVARIDHNNDPTGGKNMVYTAKGEICPEEYFRAAANCDHCGFRRKRRDTFILFNEETGEFKQIGRTCVKEFTDGLDPNAVIGHLDRLEKAVDQAIALADPVLRVFSSGAPVAENDQWGAPVVTGLPAVDLAAEAARAGAFPFAAGSSDAALLLTLPAGAYSAVVEGARGTTGAGLVEAYEIGTTGARVINLATRGFAGRDGREMVAGFVVDGAAGETKRMLVRVLGPTLGRAPFLLDGVLNDPEMEIRNAEGEVVLRGDDWSSGAEGGISSENDFRPLVKSYGEARIFATGLAPGNRREPCILADFPAGRYTVVVRPFERVSTDPGRNQPAVPGVGVVEVYEIDR